MKIIENGSTLGQAGISRRNAIGRAGALAISASAPLVLTVGGALLPSTASASGADYFNNLILQSKAVHPLAVKGIDRQIYVLTTYVFKNKYSGDIESFAIYDPTNIYSGVSPFGLWKSSDGNLTGFNKIILKNSGGLYNITVDQAVYRTPFANITAHVPGWDTNRNLTSTQWLLPDGAVNVAEYYSKNDLDANTCDYVTFLISRTAYVRAEMFYYVQAQRESDWTFTPFLTGASYARFFELFGKWKTAGLGTKMRAPLYSRTKYGLITCWAVAVVSAPFTGGVSLTAMGAITLTAATGATALTIAQQTDMLAYTEAYQNLLAFVQSSSALGA